MSSVIQDNVSCNTLLAAAKKAGFVDMATDGLLKVLQGITSIKELGRVVDIVEVLGYRD